MCVLIFTQEDYYVLLSKEKKKDYYVQKRGSS